jgi:hypothetical protein
LKVERPRRSRASGRGQTPGVFAGDGDFSRRSERLVVEHVQGLVAGTKDEEHAALAQRLVDDPERRLADLLVNRLALPAGAAQPAVESDAALGRFQGRHVAPLRRRGERETRGRKFDHMAAARVVASGCLTECLPCNNGHCQCEQPTQHGMPSVHGPLFDGLPRGSGRSANGAP